MIVILEPTTAAEKIMQSIMSKLSDKEKKEKKPMVDFNTHKAKNKKISSIIKK